MKIQYTFKDMEPWEEVRVKEYAEQKMRSLEKLLSRFQDDEVHLEVRSERYEKNNAYEVELAMEIPAKIMIGKEASHSIEKAIDLAKDRLLKQLRRHDELLKNKGKTSSSLKRAMKELGAQRVHASLEVDAQNAVEDYERTRSRELDSKPIKTF